MNICAMFDLENDVEYNLIKSLCKVFKSRGGTTDNVIIAC